LASIDAVQTIVSRIDLAESLFRNREGIQALAATPTLAQGKNLPADVLKKRCTAQP
jgi:hypothetical protein